MAEKPAGRHVGAAARALVPLMSSAVVVPRVAVTDPDWAPVAKDCHGNVEEWIRRRPESKAVHGWLLMDIQLATTAVGERRRFEFLAHSVICDPVGMMADITPAPSGSGAYPFIPHPGSKHEYENLIEVLQVARIKVHTDGKQPQVTYDSI